MVLAPGGCGIDGQLPPPVIIAALAPMRAIRAKVVVAVATNGRNSFHRSWHVLMLLHCCGLAEGSDLEPRPSAL